MQFDIQSLINLAAIIFSAGAVYQKLRSIDNTLKSMKDHGERLARLEAHFEIEKSKL